MIEDDKKNRKKTFIARIRSPTKGLMSQSDSTNKPRTHIEEDIFSVLEDKDEDPTNCEVNGNHPDFVNRRTDLSNDSSLDSASEEDNKQADERH